MGWCVFPWGSNIPTTSPPTSRRRWRRRSFSLPRPFFSLPVFGEGRGVLLMYLSVGDEHGSKKTPHPPPPADGEGKTSSALCVFYAFLKSFRPPKAATPPISL